MIVTWYPTEEIYPNTLHAHLTWLVCTGDTRPKDQFITVNHMNNTALKTSTLLQVNGNALYLLNSLSTVQGRVLEMGL